MAISGNDPFQILSKTRSVIQEGGWTRLGQSLIGTTALAVVFGGIDLLNSLLGVPIAILDALGFSVAALNRATFGGLADYVGGFLGAAAGSFGTGWTGILGPFQGPLGVGILIIMLWEIAWYLDFVDSDVLGLVIDLPILSSDEGNAAGEED